MKHLPPPPLRFLADMALTIEQPHLPGKTPNGQRKIIRVTGGSLMGEHLKANVIPGGDDWITVKEDGTIIQDVRILLQTVEEKDLIMMTYRGIRTGDPDVLERLNRNEEVNPDDYYFRTSPVFETASKKYGWLNKRIFISRGIRLQNSVNYSIYSVE